MEQSLVLKNRSVISISGEDRKSFLQGLITNDVSKASDGKAVYAFMLSPVGRFLYDFFIVEVGEKLFLDCCLEKVDEIVQKLSFYKLRSKVEIRKELGLVVVSLKSLVVSYGGIWFVDPRDFEMGFRGFVVLGDDKRNECGVEVAKPDLRGEMCDEIDDEYNLRRINLVLPDDSDLTFDKSFPLEFGFDGFNAVDYQKGCYVGQETTARMHYKGVIRKKVFLVEVLECAEIEKGAEIEVGDKKIGEILSSVLYQEKLFALALIKNVDNEGKEINLVELKLTIPQVEKEIKIIK
jgi:tRNA-modifying protein YgfZ